MNFNTMSYVDIFYFIHGSKPSDNKPIPTGPATFPDIKNLTLSQSNKAANYNSLYVHLPFCLKRCAYCPWITLGYNEAKVYEYLDALKGEVDLVKNTPYAKSTIFESLYFGGGTPSCLSADQIREMVTYFREELPLAKNCEISFEANPSSLTYEKAEALATCGVNRVSLGIQSFNESLLKGLNCSHTPESGRKAIEMLLAANLVVNIDLMYGFDGQTTADWEKDLNILADIAPQQITLYPLRIFPRTPLFNTVTKNGSVAYDFKAHEQNLKKFDLVANDILKKAGYHTAQFPSMYTKEKKESFRCIAIEPRTIAFGISAGGFMDSGESRNTFDINEYISSVKAKKLPVKYELGLTPRQVRERFIFFSILFLDRDRPDLRDFIAGSYHDYFGEDMDDIYEYTLSQMAKHNLVSIDNDRVILTYDGETHFNLPLMIRINFDL